MWWALCARAKQQGKIYCPLLAHLEIWWSDKRKLSCGVEGQKRLLEKDGHKKIRKGKNYIVVDYEKC